MAINRFIYYLEIAHTDPKDTHVYAFENVSHIPASKLIEIFNIDLATDPNISQGYLLTNEMYEIHKAFLDKEVGSLNFKLFEYTLRLYGTDEAGIREMYKEHPLE